MNGFDIIVGNPPYQSGKKGKNNSLWTKFIIKSINIINNNKYLLFVTPLSWINPSSNQRIKLRDVFFNNNLLHLNVDCDKYFNVAVDKFSFFLIKKNNLYITTKIISQKTQFEYDLSSINVLPKNINKLNLSIVKKILSNNNKLIFSSGKRVDIYDNDRLKKYKIHYTSGKFKYTNILGNNFNIKKVVASKPGYLNPIYDDGILNTSDNNYWICVNNKEEGINLITFLNAKIIKFIYQYECKYSGYNSIGVLNQLPQLDLSKSWTDEDLYKYFNLTQEEIDLIKKTIK